MIIDAVNAAYDLVNGIDAAPKKIIPTRIVDRTNCAAELDAKKKESLDAARKKVVDAQTSVDSIQQQIEEELEKIKGSVSQSSESSIEIASQMVVLGGSVLKQAEGYNPDTGKYYIAVVYY